ncbi:Heat shock protein HslJ [Lentzea xinjiangensis]|uniref:Heat shock protein HslJ n=1 Tax=Lentzea xinjiangensis TaxID=402600 RepID=A0A1H9C323_9PSEU|nr:Heat shock protein HslJ [Lentzea xinjiangensis]
MVGKTFHSTSVTEQGAPRALVEGTSVELRFTDDGRLLARAGCNQMQGPVSLDGGKLAVTDLSVTAMGCPRPELHAQDDWLAGLLGAGPSWRVDGTTLVVTGSGAEIVLAREVPAALEGGAWTVDTLITGDAASSVPGGVVATLVFGPDRVEVSAGCNAGTAQYRKSGQTLTFERVVLTDKACGPDEMAVEKAVTDALSGQVEYEVDGQALRLTNASGAGVGLRK